MRLCGLNFAADPYISSFSLTVLWKKQQQKKKQKKKTFFFIKLAQSFFEFCFCGNI